MRRSRIGARTDYTYDGVAQLLEVRHPQRTDGSQAIDSYTYDAAVQVVATAPSLLGVFSFCN